MRIALFGAAALLALTAAAPPSAPGAVVHIRDDAFVPASLTVKAGDTVAFVNDDDDAHTATADNAGWDSEGLSQGQRWTHAFVKARKVTYHCTVHPMMHGTIVVQAAARSAR